MNWTNMKKQTIQSWDSSKNAYKCNVPDGQWEEMIYVRMNPAYSTNSWDSNGKDYVWNQTSDLTIPNNGNNCYTISGSNWGDGNSTIGTWSKK